MGLSKPSLALRDVEQPFVAQMTTVSIGRYIAAYQLVRRFDVQVKTWVGDDGKNSYLSYPLKVKNYNDLIISNVSDPRILVLVTVPKDRGAWLYCTADEFKLHRAAYWLSLVGQPASANKNSVTIHIPRQNLFTADKLQELMFQADAGSPLS